MPGDETRIPGFDLIRLLETEAPAIARRRQQAFTSPDVHPPHFVVSAPPGEPPVAGNGHRGNGNGDGNALQTTHNAGRPRWPLPRDLMGLALSGGGLRSAAFNLGFIQALSRFGLFRYVDYLASVSGGAYVGGHVTAAACSVEHFHDHAESHFGVDANERLVPTSYRFRHLGEYLLNYASFLWRYIASTLATLLLFVSLLGVGACLVALIWRGHDLLLVREYCQITGINQIAEQLGIGGETLSAFIPSIPLFFAFLLLALVRRIAFQHSTPAWLIDGGDPDPAFRSSPILFLIKHASVLLIGIAILAAFLPWPVLYVIQGSLDDSIQLIGMLMLGLMAAYGAARVWLVVLRLLDGSVVHGALWIWLASLVISLAVFMGNGISGLMAGTPEYNVQSRWSWFYGLSAIASLLPIVAAGQLARSGQHNAPRWKRRLFYVLVTAATVGLPMAFIHLAARENVSGVATHRGPELLAEDILDWNAFLAMLGVLAEDPSDESSRPLQFLNVAENPQEKLSSGKLDPITLSGETLAKSAAKIQGEKLLDRYRNSPAVSPLAGTAHFVGIHFAGGSDNVFAYLAQSTALCEQRQRFLDDRVNPKLFPSAPAQIAARDKDPTTRLMELVLLRGKKEAEAKPSSTTAAGAKVPLEERRAVDEYVEKRAKEMGEGKAFVELWRRATLNGVHLDTDFTAAQREFKLSAQDRAAFNRLLLEFLYEDVIRERKMVSTLIVPEHDQWYRAGWLGIFAFLFVLSLMVDYNRWSPFYSYYRERLARYFVSVFGDARLCQPLHQFKTWEHGGPLPLILGSHFLFCRVRPEQVPNAAGGGAGPAASDGVTCSQTTTGDPNHGDWAARWPQDPAAACDASSVHPWVFSALHCGGPAAGYQPTEHYCGQKLTLADAMAISGSALTPFLVDNIFFCALMAAFNLRIGQWLPRPGHYTGKANPTARGYEIGWEIWQGCFNVDRYHKDWKLTLAADGGFHDFFGLEELLLRRCRLIIVSDAGCNNGPFEFGALADVIRLIRERHGIVILDLDNDCPADLAVLRRDKQNNVQPMHHICLRIVYPPRDGDSEPALGLLVYAQMSLTGHEPLDLQQFRNSHPDFPDEPITNQFFDSKQVESYRQLGYHVGRTVCSQLRPQVRDSAGKRFADVSDIGRELVLGYLAERLACAPIKEKESENLAPGGVDLFECRQSWCPQPPSLAVEDYVSAQISAFFTDARATCPSVEQAQQRLGNRQDADLAVRLSRHAALLLKVHRRLTGHPTKSPFRPGGRRVMIRALATAILFREVRAGNEPIHALVEKLSPAPHAWSALANLVFKTAGVETTARYLTSLLHGEGGDPSSHSSKRLQEFRDALGSGDVDALAALLQPRVPKAGGPAPAGKQESGPAEALALVD